MAPQPPLSEAHTTRLVQAATDAKSRAYCPYSKFHVGAALLTKSGEIITGVNVENASYGGAICAERTAIVKAVSEGYQQFIGLAVTTDVSSPIAPCGICRQFINEFCDGDMPVLLVPAGFVTQHPEESKDNPIRVMTVAQLLPEGFGPEQLPQKN